MRGSCANSMPQIFTHFSAGRSQQSGFRVQLLAGLALPISFIRSHPSPSSRERPAAISRMRMIGAVKLSEKKCQGVGSAPGLDPVQSVTGETFLRFLVGQSSADALTFSNKASVGTDQNEVGRSLTGSAAFIHRYAARSGGVICGRTCTPLGKPWSWPMNSRRSLASSGVS